MDYLKEINDAQSKMQDLQVEKKTLEKQKIDAEKKLEELKVFAKKEYGIDMDSISVEIEKLKNEIESELKIIQGELNGK